MLDFIRSRAQGWFAWVIVGLITVPFALWGIHNYVGGGGPTHVAKVAGVEISQSQFENIYQQQRMQLEQMFGGQLPEMFTEQMLRAQVLEQMIAQEVIIQAATGERMTVSNRQLADAIRGIEAFHEEGRFSQDLYLNLLRRQGMTPAIFESRLRRDLITEQFESAFVATAFVTPAAIDNFIRLESQQRQIDWLRVKAEAFIDQVSVAEADIQAYYEANSQHYQTPEQVKVDYLEIRADALLEDIEVDEDEIRVRYDGRLEFYRSPEERRASHILIRVDDGASETQIRTARERAENVLAQLRQGEDFATLAKELSEDPGSAQEGGDLGFFGRGMMVDSFEDVVFVMEAGQISELVRSPFGFHIIRLEEVRGGELKPYEEVREEIHAEIQHERVAQHYHSLAERLATYTYEQPDTLSIAAEELGLAVQTSAFLTRQGGPGIGVHQRVIDAAFSEDVLQRGMNSDPLEVSREQTIVLRLNQHQPAAVRPLEQVRDSIERTLTRQQAAELARETAAGVLEQIRDGQSVEQVASTEQFEWQTEVVLQRDSQTVDKDVVDAIFTMPHPPTGQVSSRLVTLANGDQFVLVLHRVEDGDPAAADEAQREQAKMTLLRADRAATSEAVLAAIRERTDIQLRREF